MIPIAEISDKMFTIPETIVFMAVCSIPGVILTIFDRRYGPLLSAIISTALISILVIDQTNAVNEYFWQAVWNELGWPWVITNYVGSLLPLAVSLAVSPFSRWRRSNRRGFEVEIRKT